MNTPKREHVLRAMAARARGRSRIQTTTATVGIASVVTAGVITLMLPGSHTSVTSSSHSLYVVGIFGFHGLVVGYQ